MHITWYQLWFFCRGVLWCVSLPLCAPQCQLHRRAPWSCLRRVCWSWAGPSTTARVTYTLPVSGCLYIYVTRVSVGHFWLCCCYVHVDEVLSYDNFQLTDEQRSHWVHGTTSLFDVHLVYMCTCLGRLRESNCPLISCSGCVHDTVQLVIFKGLKSCTMMALFVTGVHNAAIWLVKWRCYISYTALVILV